MSEFPRYKDTGNRRGFSGNLLTKIFYNKNSRVGVFSASGHEYINLYKLFELLYLNEKITVSKLRQLGISEANEFSVQRLKESIKKIVKSFIFGNPFERKYIHARSSYIRRSASYFAPEYDLCSELYIAFSKENNRPLSHKEFAERLGGHFGFLFARAASPMSWRTLTSLIGEFKGNFYQIGTLRKEFTGENYRRASSAIREYLSRREVTASKKEYNQDWLNPDVIDFHIIALLLRDLGIGIGSLEKIDSISFKISLRDRFKFERHHIFKNDKKSIDPNRIVLVLKGLHPYLENLDAKLINTLIDQMLDWSSDSCPDYYKNSYPDTWREQWAEVIDRRNFIKKEGVGRFLLDFYPDVIERVFGSNVAARTIELGIRGMIHSWIQKYNTIPKLPNTILSKLGLVSSQVQITNFLGNPNP
ncbi:MAG: hypothetical protein CEE43_16400 [Promethearchaeota archaeon Loki_b32]|nr:MAG: hypothetical protein CEE43_16400 [Candidatus Lokiarchaeota archaeon Loki_b32]